MTTTSLHVLGLDIPVHRCHTLVIGSGAASLNAADHLYSFGIKDIIIATERLGGGTSNNSGSDKQTYYKLSLSGDGPDSVYEMARTLFSGGAMHGDIALIEATLSAQEFYHLVHIGVPFPHDRYGGYVGYKTDHDPRQRATSAGPWTSNQMFARLLDQVRAKGIRIMDQHEVIALITLDEDDHTRVAGAVAIDKQRTDDDTYGLVVFSCENIVMGTGGPGGIYQASVYPEGHLGSTGVALEAGASAVNLTEWQYGLASTKFRWNVSGTYQQVIPRYISTDQNCGDERQFLNDYFGSMGKLATNVFLKGYQWPFDVRKIPGMGSSVIDVLVYIETVVKGRRVFMDFRHNPSGDGRLRDFAFDDLEPEAYRYLERSHALSGTPIDRLEKMNPMAIDLYRQHGIDLRTEPLEVAVCAQHNNGGLEGGIWWESNLRHLFPVGEVNGTHGVYRPGGSALNSGQVGGLRAAEFIKARYCGNSVDAAAFGHAAAQLLAKEITFIQRMLEGDGRSPSQVRSEIQSRMSRCAAHIREREAIEKAISEAEADLSDLLSGRAGASSRQEIVSVYQNRQLCLTHLAVLKSIEAYLDAGGGSRGSYLVIDPEGADILPEARGKLEGLDTSWRYRPEDESMRSKVLRVTYDQSAGFRFEWVPVRGIPSDESWFETVWSSFTRGDIFSR